MPIRLSRAGSRHQGIKYREQIREPYTREDGSSGGLNDNEEGLGELER